MNRYVACIMFEMMQYRRSDIDRTQDFIKMEHNKHLCPTLQKKCEEIFDSLKKYHRITYDIQGPRDMGTDVIIRFEEKDETRFICFQIKSEEDLKKKGYLKTLKSQFFDFETHFISVSDYYILLCCDGKQNKEKIRLIEGEFAKKDKAHVVEPEFALTFLRLNRIHIDALIKSILGHDDVVLRKALTLVSHLTPNERGVTYYLIWARTYESKQQISFEELVDSPFINKLYEIIPDYDREWFDEDEIFDDEEYEDEEEWRKEFELRGLDQTSRLSEDLNTLESDFITMDRGTKTFQVILEHVLPLMTLMIDGQIRYSYTGDDLLEYMMNLLGPMKGYEGPIMDT